MYKNLRICSLCSLDKRERGILTDIYLKLMIVDLIIFNKMAQVVAVIKDNSESNTNYDDQYYDEYYDHTMPEELNKELNKMNEELFT